ncbi:MAG TPA: BamA/TamA family outer membrane protein [Bryobacteraceae bacterium]|nr:BamA/TamA family outer membrane protein [Bryobacteraceae bacterium]
MKCAWLGCLLWGGLLFAGNQQAEFNVNCRYTVESVELSGDTGAKISAGLREELTRLVGENLNPPALDQVAKRIRHELHVRSVTHRVLRGTQPQHVKVVFDVGGRSAKFEVSVPKFLYHSNEGWSGLVEGTTTVGNQAFTLGLVSDGDELAERYSGLLGRYENRKLGTSRLRFRFQFESYHEQWNQATRQNLEPAGPPPSADYAGLYRTRQNFEPVATLVLAAPLTLSVGTGFQRFETQYPAARTEASNSLITTLRYHRVLEGSEANQQDLDAGYNLRAATRILNSDFAYVRHHWEVRYRYSRGASVILDDFAAGLITGQAPLFERFVLGNSSTLRGWNKFELDPLGGSRVVHNSVEYRYRVVEIFYDTGAIWDRNQPVVPRHAVGVGLRQGNLSLAVAFPVKEGRIEPIFMVGMNY